MKLLARLLILTGIILFVFSAYLIWQRDDPNRLAFTNYHYQERQDVVENNLPVRLTIPDLHIDLPILPARIEKNVWPTTSDGASYLASSPIPGNVGNSIIYGHNWASLLGNLPAIKPGAPVEITFADNTKKTFIVTYTAVVSPDQRSILDASQDRRITIYTCTGFLDSKRFVAVAVLKDN